MVRCVLAVLVVGCSFRHGILPPDSTAADAIDAPIDVAIDAPPLTCMQRWLMGTIRFAPALPLTGVNTLQLDRDPFLTPDELTIYWSSEQVSALGGADVYTATRTAIGAPWGATSLYAPASSGGYDSKMTLTADDLLLVVASDQTGTRGGSDLWQAARTSTTPFGPLDESNEGKVDDVTDQFDPMLSQDGLRLYYSGGMPQQLMFASRPVVTANFAAGQVISELAYSSAQGDPTVSSDELVIVYTSGRTDAGHLGSNLWYATRADTSQAFGTPLPVPDVNGDAYEGDAHLSADGCRLYFASDVAGGRNWDLFVATAM